MVYGFLKCIGLPISQVSYSGPPALLPLLPSIILPSSCSQTALPQFPHHSVHKCTHNLPFYTPSAPQFHFSLPCSLSLHFHFFLGLFMAALRYWYLSHLSTLYCIIFTYPHILHDPSHPFAPVCPPYDLCVHVNMSLLALSKGNLTTF